jgi:hypothetical protein
MNEPRPDDPNDVRALPAPPSFRERWTLSPSAARFVRDRAATLRTDPATVLEDVILVERRRVEGAI